VVATDTQKNTIFAFAKDGIASPETFLMRLADHFTSEFDWVTGGRWAAEQYGWSRIDDHDHSFFRSSPETRTALLVRDGYETTVISGFFGLTVLKTTGRRQLRAHRHRLPVRWAIHDATRPWPFRDRAFDAVVVSLVLEHVEALAPVYAEAGRVLARGGELQVAELHPRRQERGSRARYVDPASGTTRQIAAWVHPEAEHRAAAAAAGLALVARDELAADGDALPRLLRLRFRATT
jgi:SAM-dependent methyltransferase